MQDDYNLEDESPSWQSYSLEGQEEEVADEKPCEDGKKVEPNSLSFAVAIIRILITPVEGWKAFKRIDCTPSAVNSNIMYPMIALCMSARLLSLLGWDNYGVAQALPVAIVTFCSLFFGYFCILLAGKLLLPKASADKLDTDFGRKFVSASLTTVALFDAISYALAPLQTILVFLPLWTIFIIFKGVRFLDLPSEDTGKVATLLSVLVIGLPIGLDWIMDKLITI